MGLLPETDDVDIVVDGRDSDPDSLKETAEFIKAYKSRPEYAEEVRKAREILDALRVNTKGYKFPDPAELLAQWHRTVAEIKQKGLNGSAEPEVASESTESR